MLVGIPQSGSVRLRVTPLDVRIISGVTVRPMADFVARAVAAAPGGFWPSAWAELAGIDVLRGVRVADIRLHPVQYDAARQEIRYCRRLAVAVEFERPAEERIAIDRAAPFFARPLVNGAQASAWRLDRLDDTVNFFRRYDVWCKVRTESTGIYRLTAADLAAAGFATAGIDPRTFRLFCVGDYVVNEDYPDTMTEVPVYVTGEDDGRFDKDDRLAFYAEAPSHWNPAQDAWEQNLYTNYRVFWLTWGKGPGRRMATVSGAGAGAPQNTAPHHVRLERDLECPARSGLLWLWKQFFKQAGLDSVRNEVALDLPGRSAFAEIRGRIYGAKEAEDPTAYHYARLYLNGVLLDTLAIQPRSSTPPPANFVLDSIPAEAVRPGVPDTLAIEIYGDPEMVDYLDFLEVRYTEELALSAARPAVSFSFPDSGPAEFAVAGAADDGLLLEVTDHLAPLRVTDARTAGGRLEVRRGLSAPAEFHCALASRLRAPVSVERRTPGGLRDATEQADYYIICPDEFLGAATVYARYRDGNVPGLAGARARAVGLAGIYDEYTFGMEEPAAIQRFFAHKRPAYGLLAGDATYDYRNNFGGQVPPGVPAYEMGYDIDPEVYGLTARAFDAWYADFEGLGGTPDMILGRITCRSAVELRSFLDKVRTYESQPLGAWARRMLLMADDEWLGEPVLGKRDPIGFSHISGCENIGSATGAVLDPTKLYLTEYPFTGVNDKSGARQELLNQLYRGYLAWCFFGHGAGFQLCHERALNIDGVGEVKTGTRNPVGFYGSCGVGRFEDTRYQAIAEELVRMAGGCIATLAASKATTPGQNELFARLFFTGMVAGPDSSIGASFYDAWVTYTLYHLFGDPATRLRVPVPGIAPVVAPDTFYPGDRTAVTDSVPLERGMYSIHARESDWYRFYSSDAGSTVYDLPGYDLFSGLGTFDSGMVRASFVVPDIDYPDTVVTPNGYYARQPGTGVVSLLAWNGGPGYGSRRSALAVGERRAAAATRPPQLALAADGRPRGAGDRTAVPEQFELAGVLSDESGILLAPVPDYTLSFYQGASTNRVDLRSRFSYDKNSATTGRFSYPVKLTKEDDSLTVIAADNCGNRLTRTFHVRTDMSDMLRFADALVYPNPVTGPALFTFELSEPAFVTVKIFTMSGRLVRLLPSRACPFGYNQVEWDGRDKDGNPLANGVYLYKLDARSSATGTGLASGTAAYRDKFIVQR